MNLAIDVAREDMACSVLWMRSVSSSGNLGRVGALRPRAPATLSASPPLVVAMDGMFDAVLTVSVPAFVCAGIAFFFIFFLYTKIWSYAIGKDIGVPHIDDLAAQIRSGAASFLTTEYKFLSVFVVALAMTLFGLFYSTTPSDPLTTATAVSTSFVGGAFLSASAGWWGMMVATDGNRKTTSACAGCERYNKKATLNDGLEVAFTTGAVMGFAVVGLGLLGVSTCFLILSSLEFEGHLTASQSHEA